MKRAISTAILVSAVSLISCQAALAGPVEDAFQAQIGTLWVKGTPSFAGGELAGCTLEYLSAIKDNVYKQGAVAIIRGSVGLMKASSGFAVTLKVIVNDINSKTAASLPDAPEAAYLVSGFKTSKDAVIGSAASDTPGGLFTIFKTIPAFEMLSDGIGRHEIGISFRRRGGKADVTFTIDPTVIATDDNGKRTISVSEISAYTECVKTLLDNASTKAR